MTIQELNDESRALLKANVQDIEKRMANAKKNREGNEVTLLAATKTVPASVVNYVTHELGIKHIGENRVQELLDKYDDLDLEGVELHFFG